MHGSAACYWVTRLSCFPADAGFIDYYYASSDIDVSGNRCVLPNCSRGWSLPACLAHLAVVCTVHLDVVHLAHLCNTVHCASPGCSTPGAPMQLCALCTWLTCAALCALCTWL